MEEHITPQRIANSIMLDTSFSGYYLIVEGPKDSKLYGKFFSQEIIHLKEAFGNEKVKEVFTILSERGFDRKFGIIDADFTRITGEEIEVDGLFITDDHDIEVMVIKTKALEHVLNVFCSKNKMQEYEKKHGMTIRDRIFQLGKEIGYLKYANKIHDLGLVFKCQVSQGCL